MEEKGWSDAETSRRINVSRAAISQIRSGKNTPTVALEKLRLAVAGGSVDAVATSMKEQGRETTELRWRLDYLERHDVRAFESVKGLINTLYERAKAVNSTPDAVARVALAGAVADLEKNRPAGSRRSPGVDGSSGKTSGPKSNGQKH